MDNVVDSEFGLRRRRGGNNMNDQIRAQPPLQRGIRPRRRRPGNENRERHMPGMLHIKLTHVYCLTSTILAILAIVAATPVFLEVESSKTSHSPHKSPSQWTTVDTAGRGVVANVAGRTLKGREKDTRDLLQSIQQWWDTHRNSADAEQVNIKEHPDDSFWLLRLWKPSRSSTSTPSGNKKKRYRFEQFIRDQRYLQWIDPTIVQPSITTPTDIIDKILTSTPRLLAIANFLLAMTYLLHSAIATWFLGPLQLQFQHRQSPNRANQGGLVVDWSTSAGARERMGGFLVFKLLLISAVVAPDTLDLLILLTWYTMLSCLRSLDHLANATTTHLVALGQPPRSGIAQLLVLVLVCNILAAACCVALFHAAGWGMVLLLTCDCALLAADVISHILKHLQCVLEDRHSQRTQALETRQVELHFGEVGAETNWSADNIVTETAYEATSESFSVFEIPPHEYLQLDRQTAELEVAHARRLSILDTVEFILEMICHLLTVSHFLHLWSLHGVQFTLIDGVLALHLHSAISSGCKKVAERRNIHSIARDLQGLFANATDQELRKASSAGDVCCICLNTMLSGGHVKKVHCGHLYHTHCLREVVERAQTIQAAKCPLCRASILNGRLPGNESNSAIASNMQPRQDPAPGATIDPPHQQAQPVGGDEHALFRFSTEGFVPAWLPIPAFSFEVVRRPSTQPQTLPLQPHRTQEEGDDVPRIESAPENQEEPNRLSERIHETELHALEHREEGHQSFFRRLLVLAGAIPMSPEEEAQAVEQLADMFPQYDRGDLLREVRARGSAEAVAEAVLMGFFSGAPHGD